MSTKFPPKKMHSKFSAIEKKAPSAGPVKKTSRPTSKVPKPPVTEVVSMAAIEADALKAHIAPLKPKPTGNDEWAEMTKLDAELYRREQEKLAQKEKEQKEHMRRQYQQQLQEAEQKKLAALKEKVTDAQHIAGVVDSFKKDEEKLKKKAEDAKIQNREWLAAEREKAESRRKTQKQREREEGEAQLAKIRAEEEAARRERETKRLQMKHELDSVKAENDRQARLKHEQAKKDAQADFEKAKAYEKLLDEQEAQRKAQLAEMKEKMKVRETMGAQLKQSQEALEKEAEEKAREENEKRQRQKDEEERARRDKARKLKEEATVTLRQQIAERRQVAAKAKQEQMEMADEIRSKVREAEEREKAQAEKERQKRLQYTQALLRQREEQREVRSGSPYAMDPLEHQMNQKLLEKLQKSVKA